MEHISPESYEALLAVVRDRYGYDFQDYAPSSLKRRIGHCMRHFGLSGPQELTDRISASPEFFQAFVSSLTVNVTEMFRDPACYRALREQVLPTLASYPSIKVWHAGCSTGEEVFSVCILLQEAGLLGRARVYATDINPVNLERARNGILPLHQMKYYTQNYIHSGGKQSFSDYYTARYDHAIIQKDLRRNIFYSQHNLVTDSSFNEFQLIVCRNVLIYFNKSLQRRTIELFNGSLASRGFLFIGSKESLSGSEYSHEFESADRAHKIYRRKT